MSEVVLGSLALFLEGVFFFLLQEPDLARRLPHMHHVREYFAALFAGWVGRMSGGASVILTFLPIVFPRFFSDTVWAARSIWIAAALCFLVANYSAWKYERDKYEAEKAKNEEAPLMSMNFYSAISRGALQSGLTDIFIYMEIILKSPSSVSVDNYSLVIFDNSGFHAEAIAIDDVEEWALEKTEDGKTRITRCLAIPKELSRRGDPVQGWIHFPIAGTAESFILRCGFRIKANCPHGSCSVITAGQYAQVDPVAKGVMRRITSEAD